MRICYSLIISKGKDGIEFKFNISILKSTRQQRNFLGVYISTYSLPLIFNGKKIIQVVFVNILFESNSDRKIHGIETVLSRPNEKKSC
jgi:hypothetical protein